VQEYPLRTIFFTFFKIGTFTFGGGYAMLPLIRSDIVENCCWLKDDEFMDILAATQCVPGPLAVNAALLIGYRLKGLPGAAVALLGTILPSFFIMLTLAVFFLQLREQPLVDRIFSGIRPAVAALIAVAALKLGKPLLKKRDSLILLALFSILAIFFDVHPIVIIVGAGVLGWLIYGREKVDEKEDKEGDKERC
jgi:chromate transporter